LLLLFSFELDPSVATIEHLEVLEIRSCDFEELKFDSPGHQSRSSANGNLYSIDVVIVIDCHHLQDLTWLALFWPKKQERTKIEYNYLQKLLSKVLSTHLHLSASFCSISKNMKQFCHYRSKRKRKYIQSPTHPTWFLIQNNNKKKKRISTTCKHLYRNTRPITLYIDERT